MHIYSTDKLVFLGDNGYLAYPLQLDRFCQKFHTEDQETRKK